jgi:hypothetical protein
VVSIRFLMHNEVGERVRLAEAVEAAHPWTFLRGELGHLRLESVEGGDRLDPDPFRRDFVIRIEQSGDPGKWTRIFPCRFAHPRRLRELPSGHRVQSREIEPLRQILFDELLQASLCPGGELAQVLWKRANVEVILLGIEAERFFGEASRIYAW